MLGAEDESDDHASLGEPLFDSDAEFSSGEDVEEALKSGDADHEDVKQGGMEEHAGKPVAKAIARPVSPSKAVLENTLPRRARQLLSGMRVLREVQR